MTQLNNDIYLYSLSSSGDPIVKIFIKYHMTAYCFHGHVTVPISDLLGKSHFWGIFHSLMK